MVNYVLKISADLENLTNLQPSGGCDDSNFPYLFKVFLSSSMLRFFVRFLSFHFPDFVNSLVLIYWTSLPQKLLRVLISPCELDLYEIENDTRG